MGRARPASADRRRIVVSSALLLALLCGSHLLDRECSRTSRFLVSLLERRFEPADITAGEALTGIIVLTGGDRRLSEAGRLARDDPHLKVVISGARGVPGVMTQLGKGIEPSRVVLETRSRNTHENALYSAELIGPKPGERWLLVTGASHMPRSIGSFRKVGFEVEPWPVYDLSFCDRRLLDVAAREWLGLLAYRLLGWTNALFPTAAD